jgi:hypothetical protein
MGQLVILLHIRKLEKEQNTSSTSIHCNPLNHEKNVKVLFSQMLTDIRNSFAFLKVFHALPLCPSGKSSIKVQMRVGRWWYDTDMGMQRN